MKPISTILSEARELCAMASSPYTIGRIQERENWSIEVPCPPSDSGLKKWPLCEFYGGVSNPKNDLNFIVASRTDMPKFISALNTARLHLETISRGVVNPEEYSLGVLAEIQQILNGGGE